LAKAIDLIEHRCTCAITYEDPIYDSGTLVDWTPRVRRDGKAEPKIFGPPERMYSFDASGLGTTPGTDLDVAVLSAFVDSFNRHDGLDSFSVTETSGTLHVAPTDKPSSVLRVQVSIPDLNGTTFDGVVAVLAAVTAVTGRKVGIATAPMLKGTLVHQERVTDSAERILSRLLQATGQRLSWRLLYDYGFEFYGLNVHTVR
jgi:hypothetical protein